MHTALTATPLPPRSQLTLHRTDTRSALARSAACLPACLPACLCPPSSLRCGQGDVPAARLMVCTALTDAACVRACVRACMTCSELAEHTTLFDAAAAPHHPAGEHVGQGCSQPPGTAGSEGPTTSTNTAPAPPPPSLVAARWRQLQRLGLRLLWLRHEPVGPVAGPVRDHSHHRHHGQNPAAAAAAAGQRDHHRRARSSRRPRPRPRRPDLAPDAAWNLRRTAAADDDDAVAEGGAERALSRWGVHHGHGPAALALAAAAGTSSLGLPTPTPGGGGGGGKSRVSARGVGGGVRDSVDAAAAAAVPAAALSSAEACFERGDGHRCLIQVGPCHRAVDRINY
eukprot:COSAG01_NODE_1368_length_10555_cov_25.123757_2_plen_341_part_00